MLHSKLNSGDLVKLPQGVTAYKKVSSSDASEFDLVYAESIEKPSIAIFIEHFNDNVSKLYFEDRIRYVYTQWLFEVGATDAC